jgi:hypothetical protein
MGKYNKPARPVSQSEKYLLMMFASFVGGFLMMMLALPPLAWAGIGIAAIGLLIEAFA